jgi:hypothetical protein
MKILMWIFGITCFICHLFTKRDLDYIVGTIYLVGSILY